MAYIDGYLLAVAADKKADYLHFAQEAVQLFREQGALRVVECWGDEVPEGKLTSMPMAVKCKDDEVVVFSWVEWPSKAVRDRGMQAVMQHPQMANAAQRMPFDGQRVIFGGFETLLDA